MSISKNKYLRLINVAAFVITVAVNAIAEIFQLGGVKTGEISKKYENLFTPAEYAFAIWGLIYLLLAGFVLYQAGAFKRWDKHWSDIAARLGWWFAASCALNAAWVFAWHYDYIAFSTVIIFGLLATLIVIAQKTNYQADSWQERMFAQIPFSIYYGWITVASIANVCVLLTKLGWDGWGISPQLWMVIILVVGTLIAGTAILKNVDMWYGLAVIWAYTGIIVKHVSPNGWNSEYPSVITTAALCIAALLIATALTFQQNKRPAKNKLSK